MVLKKAGLSLGNVILLLSEKNRQGPGNIVWVVKGNGGGGRFALGLQALGKV